MNSAATPQAGAGRLAVVADTSKQVDDRASFEAWCAGDKAVGAQLFDRHFAALSRFFANKASDAADDLIQKTFLSCIEARGRYRAEATFRGFLFGIAHNVLRNHYRTANVAHRNPDFGITSIAALVPTPTALLDARGEQRNLLEALRRIPLEHQVVLELMYWERMSASQIGAALDTPEGTVRSRLRRAKSLLAAELISLKHSREPLETTIHRLDDWAKRVRGSLFPDAS